MVERVRATLGPRVGLRVDPNGSWSLSTALRALRRLEPLDLEYVEEPVRAQGTGDATVSTDSLRRLRAATTTPIAADHCYRPDLLALVIRAEAADVALADLFGAGGLTEARHYARMAASFGLGVALHSGTELGVGQMAKAHLQASLPDEVRFAGDAIYPEYVDDVLVGGALAIERGRAEAAADAGAGAGARRGAAGEVGADGRAEGGPGRVLGGAQGGDRGGVRECGSVGEALLGGQMANPVCRRPE